MAGAGRSYVQPRAAWKVTLDGQDLTQRMAPRLIGLRLTEQRGEEGDQLEITLEDSDGKLALPPEGARLTVQLGWDRGSGVAVGLVDKGSFLVDQVGWDGPPDQVTIRARSADFADTFRKRRTRTWKDQTLGAILQEVAGAHGLTAKVHGDLAGKQVTAAEQHNKSDMEFLRDLGRRYDAVATVKDGKLLFAPIDAATTATGAPLPSLTLTRSKGDRYRYERAARDGAEQGAEADWHDPAEAKRKRVQKGGGKRRKLKKVYASEADAGAAAQAETNRRKRAVATFELTLAYGDATAAPGVKITAQGFKDEVDGHAWRIASVDHRMDGQGGFSTELRMEVAG